MKKCIQIKVTGKVQGVFYRKYAVAKANELGITGFVKNENDGTVYIEAFGQDELLSLFVDWCYTGSPNSKVANVEVALTNENVDYLSFVQR